MTNEPDELSVLDYFAAAALTGVVIAMTTVALAEDDDKLADNLTPLAARSAYEIAEAMMAERAKRQPTPPKEAGE